MRRLALALLLLLLLPTSALAQFKSGTPVLSSCGTSPAITGNNLFGVITLGTGTVTGSTATFSAAWPTTAPACTASSNSTTALLGLTTTKAAMTIALSVSLPGGKITYYCPGLD